MSITFINCFLSTPCMFRRYLQNRLAGRRKAIDEELGIEETRAVLGGLADSIQGMVGYHSTYSDFTESGLSPSRLLGFLNDKFSSAGGNYYVDIQHQVYVGASGEQHYLELQKGNVYDGDKEKAFRRGTIEFLVQ